jgi:hypothetical protein
MKKVLKVIQLIIALPIFWISTLLLMLACAINPELYPVFTKHAKKLGETK